MIIYFEGLPRSGKSLNALKDYGIPALQKGRAVDAFIAGLNHEKIAELAGITLEECKELLKPLTREQSREFHKHVRKDSLVILDEAESSFPEKRQPLEEELRTYIAEHGQYGHDIVLMGQNFEELHKTWKSRTEQKIYFLKRTAAGKVDEYSVTIYRGTFDGKRTKWEELQHIKGLKYDEQYFGAYSSHKDGTGNKETFVDARANIWNSPIMKRWVPIIAFVMIGSVIYLGYYFMGGGIQKDMAGKSAKKETPPAPQPVQKVETKTATAPPPQVLEAAAKVETFTPPEEPLDYIDQMTSSNRIRLAGSVSIRGHTAGVIEWRGQSFALVERFTFADLMGLGWSVFVNQSGTVAWLQKGARRYIATAWPMPDPQGTVTEAKSREIAAGTEAPTQVALH